MTVLPNSTETAYTILLEQKSDAPVAVLPESYTTGQHCQNISGCQHEIRVQAVSSQAILTIRTVNRFERLLRVTTLTEFNAASRHSVFSGRSLVISSRLSYYIGRWPYGKKSFFYDTKVHLYNILYKTFGIALMFWGYN